MGLVFLGVLPAAWIAAGSERISYAGIQVGLAFLLTIFNGYSPTTDMDAAAEDRIAGILVGNLVVYLILTQIWPTSAVLRLAITSRRL